MIFREILSVRTESGRFYDVTESINSVVVRSGISDGICHTFLQGTTAGLMINENDRMLYEDMRKFFEAAAPEKKLYQHPDNAFSHIRASLLNQEMSIPVANGALALGTWQRILLWEFDVRKRDRSIIVTVSG